MHFAKLWVLGNSELLMVICIWGINVDKGEYNLVDMLDKKRSLCVA